MPDEASVCDRFEETAKQEGWTVYPEVDQWDLVCVWEKKHTPSSSNPYPQPGDQLAVEAKSRCRVKALEQCIRRLGLQLRQPGRASYKDQGPDFTAIAAPTIGESFGFVARCMGLHTYEVDSSFGNTGRSIKVSQSKRFDFDDSLWVPPVVPDIQAGTSSPSRLTQWKVQALKLCAIFRARGWASTADFKRLDISKTIWRRKWMSMDGYEKVSYQGDMRRFGRYTPDWDQPPDTEWRDEQREIMAQNPDDVPDQVVETFLSVED
jgi:hypothetical protein